jgi:small subunit ribosomal protein S8
MSMTDPIADMLSRIRNALLARKEKVEVPASAMKEEIARILKEEGFIREYKLVKDDRQGMLTLSLKYAADARTPAITNLTRVSKPGRRVYVGSGDIPKVLDGMGIAILSTSRGLLTDRESRKQTVGGEVVCYVW